MKKAIFLFSFLSFANNLFGQLEGVMYPIDTLDDYGLSYSQYGDNYTIEGKQVTKQAFDTLLGIEVERENCCPCLIRHRSKIDSSIIFEQVRCGRRNWVGEYRSYDSLRNIILSGYYTSFVPKKISDTLSCGQGDPGNKTGTWVKYYPNGDTISTEIWDNGIFISESKKEKECSIWGYYATLNEGKVNQTAIPIDSLNRIKVNVFYKNDITDCEGKIWINLFVGSKQEYFELEFQSYPFTDFRELFKERGIIDFSNLTLWFGIVNPKQTIPQMVLSLTE